MFELHKQVVDEKDLLVGVGVLGQHLDPAVSALLCILVGEDTVKADLVRVTPLDPLALEAL